MVAGWPYRNHLKGLQKPRTQQNKNTMVGVGHIFYFHDDGEDDDDDDNASYTYANHTYLCKPYL